MFNSAICLIIKDENDYINEWLEWHINIGFQHFYIYDNGSKILIKNSVNEKYLSYCTFIDFSNETEQIQSKCYAHALKSLKKDVKWLAFIDTDEFIRLVNNDNINDFLKEYEKFDGIYIKWNIYNANGLIKKDNRSQRERFTQISNYMPLGPIGKSIIQPEKIYNMSYHFPAGWKGQYKMVDSDKKIIETSLTRTMPINKIVVDHYFTRSYEEWMEKIERKSCDLQRKSEEFFLFNPDMEKVIKNNLEV